MVFNRGKKQNKTIRWGQTKKHNFAHQLNLVWTRLLKSVIFIWVKKKERKKEGVKKKSIYQVLNVPAPFIMTSMHIPFNLWKWALPCWREFPAPDECNHTHCLLTRDDRQDESTHQHARVFFANRQKLLFFMGLVAIHPQEFFFLFSFLCFGFLLFKMSFRYLNKCCCSSFK